MISIIILTLIGISAAQLCPPPEVLYPCICTDIESAIFCEGIQEDFNLKGIFDNASSFIDNDFVFNLLVINDTSISAIEEAAIQHLKFWNIYIGYNSKLTYISPRAFDASASFNTTREMVIQDNPIENRAPYERDIFDFIKSFNKLYDLELTGSRISSIPDYAFQNSSSLRFLYLEDNNISTIGVRPFSDLVSLRFIYFTGNSITSEGIHEEAFDYIGELGAVFLDCNKIDYLEQKRFQRLLEANTYHVSVGDSDNYCGPGNEYERLHCDERADWICDNDGKYWSKLKGFRCKNGSGYEDVWDYCGGRNVTFSI